VFEGEVTQSQLARIERGILRIIEPDYDSVLIYVLRDNNWLDRRSLGARKGEPTNLI
jgi:CRISPR-associated protein Cas2